LCSQKKETKEKATPLPLVSFGLSAASGRLRNSPSNFIQAQTVLAAFHLLAQAEGAARGFKVKTLYFPPSF
jgi:hypothetical protein